MSERFKRIYIQQPNLYSEGLPILIVAGALSIDKQNNSVFVQLRMKNISKETVTAVYVEILPISVTGEVIGPPIEHSYLDLTCCRNAEFGGKTVIHMPDNTTRSFSARITEIIFEGNISKKYENKDYNALPEQKSITDVYSKNQRIAFSTLSDNKGEFIPLEFQDLRICSCGNILNNSEDICPFCNNDFLTLFNVSDDELEKEGGYIQAIQVLCKADSIKKVILDKPYQFKASAINACRSFIQKDEEIYKCPNELESKLSLYRSALESFELYSPWKDSEDKAQYCQNKIEELEQEISNEIDFQKNDAIKTKKLLIKTIIITASVIVAIVFFSTLNKHLFTPLHMYNTAIKNSENGNYTEAYSVLTELGDFLDASSKIPEIKTKEANEALDKGDYNKAYKIFNELGNTQIIQESKYTRAQEYLNEGNLLQALSLLDTITEYKDAKDIADKTRYDEGVRLLNEGNYKDAYAYLEKCKSYADANSILNKSYYTRAEAFVAKGNYKSAAKLYYKVSSKYYSDAEQKYQDAKNISVAQEEYKNKNYGAALEYCKKVKNNQYTAELAKKCNRYVSIVEKYVGKYERPYYSRKLIMTVDFDYSTCEMSFSCVDSPRSYSSYSYYQESIDFDYDNPEKKLIRYFGSENSYYYQFANGKLYCKLSEYDSIQVFTKIE